MSRVGQATLEVERKLVERPISTQVTGEGLKEEYRHGGFDSQALVREQVLGLAAAVEEGQVR